MRDPKTLKHHAELVDRMAHTVGVDLEEAVRTGALPFDALAETVLRCTECSAPGACAHWLDQAQPGSAAPGFCRNGDLFATLVPEAQAGPETTS